MLYILLLSASICCSLTDFECSDDITVEVIFFGQGPDLRTVEINKDASASEDQPKAKL